MTALTHCSNKQNKINIDFNHIKKPKILILDDEDSVRFILRKLLQKLGFEVVSVRTSAEAINEMQNSIELHDHLDFAILDIVLMQDISGIEVLKKLFEVNPGLNAIATTGYSPYDIARNYRTYGFKACLSKPYRIDELKKALQKLIAEEK